MSISNIGGFYYSYPTFSAMQQTPPAQTQEIKKEASTAKKVTVGTLCTAGVLTFADICFAKGKHLKKLFGIADDVKNSTNIQNQTVETVLPCGARVGNRSEIPPESYGAWLNENHWNFNVEKACENFHTQTNGVRLHAPCHKNLATSIKDPFGGNCIQLEDAFRRGVIPDQYRLKHVLIGHGMGSSINCDWVICGTNHKVFDYIDRFVPKGERVIVTCCETYGTVPGKNAIGTSVMGPLLDRLHPAKIVESGRHEVIGEMYFPKFMDGAPVIRMYDAPQIRFNV